MEAVKNEIDIESDYKGVFGAAKDLDRTFVKQPMHASRLPPKVKRTQIEGLSRFQKTLLVTDGTVTELLEHYLDEFIEVEKVYEKVEEDASSFELSDETSLDADDLPVLIRKVLLKGKTTSVNWLYAESVLFINNLTEDFRHDLLVSQMPIGKLWSKHRYETYKTDFTVIKEKANKEIAEYLGVSEGSEILARTYRVYSLGKITMIITEKFSAECFVD